MKKLDTITGKKCVHYDKPCSRKKDCDGYGKLSEPEKYSGLDKDNKCQVYKPLK